MTAPKSLCYDEAGKPGAGHDLVPDPPARRAITRRAITLDRPYSLLSAQIINRRPKYSGTSTTPDTWLRNVFKIHSSTLDWAVSVYSTGAPEYSNSTTVTVTTPVKYYPWIGDFGKTTMGGDVDPVPELATFMLMGLGVVGWSPISG